MKRILYILVWSLCSLTTLTAQTFSENYTKDRPVVVVCDWDKPPYEFLDDHGQPAGSNIDVLKHILGDMGLPVTFVMKEWSNAVKTFERGDADLILANANRFKGNEFAATQIINYNRMKVAMMRDTTKAITLKTLEEEGVALKTGDYSVMFFNINKENVNRIEFQSPKVGLTGLISGDNHYFVWGEEPLKWKIKELNLEGIYLNEVEIPVSEEHLVGRDKFLVYQIDDRFSRLKQSGDLEELLNKWYHPERVKSSTPPVAIYISIGVLLLISLLMLLNYLAKRHVEATISDTKELNKMMIRAMEMGDFNVMEYDIAKNRFTNHYGTLLPDQGLTLEEFSERIHPDQREEFKEKMGRLLEGRGRQFDLEKLWNAGTPEDPQWLNLHGHAISEMDEYGRPAFVVNALHNVTQFVEEDRAMRELLGKYNTLLNMPNMAISYYDQNGWLMYMNDAMKTLCGFNKKNNGLDARRYWGSMNMFDIPLLRNTLHPEMRDTLKACHHMSYPEMDIDNYTEYRLTPLFDKDGNVVNFFNCTVDMTEYQKIDALVHRDKNEVLQDQCVICKLKDRLEFALLNSDRYLWRSNIKDQKICFYRQLETPIIEVSFDVYLSMVAEEDRERLQKLLTSNEQQSGEAYHFLKTAFSEEESWYRISCRPAYDEKGNITGHDGVFVNVTSLIRACQRLEEQTQLANNSVRHKSEFMASMTHELRTPLNAIVGFTSVLEAMGDSPDRAEYVQIIRNSSEMLQRLINDIIEASTFTEGKLSIVKEDVDFSKAFDEICLMLQQRVEQQPGVAFIKDSPGETLWLRTDVERIQQLLTNLVTNAVKFTQQGHIRVGYQEANGILTLYCEDTGKGIAKDKQERIFQRFVKLDEFSQGTGMGLAICKSIVGQMGGEMGVRSEGEGKGCYFWIQMPCEKL